MPLLLPLPVTLTFSTPSNTANTAASGGKTQVISMTVWPAEEPEDENMAHPILRARQALRCAEAQTESAEYADGDIEAGPGMVAPEMLSLARQMWSLRTLRALAPKRGQ